MIKDPVCGTEVDEEKVMVMNPHVCGIAMDEERAVVMSTYQEKAYYFCCLACQEAFEKEPEKFL